MVSMQLSVFVYILHLHYVFCATELPVWHLKPLGSHIQPNKVDESFFNQIISPKEFVEKYVLKRKPIIFRNIAKEWPAYKLWTDEYLTEKYGEMELRIEGKKEKQSGIPQGDVCLGRDRMKTFLKEYRDGVNKYVVSDLPTPMWNEVHVPPPMSCGEFLSSYVEIDLWMNSDLGKKGQGGNSILHKDAFNTVNCVVNGTKDWKLFELKHNDFLYQSWEGPMDAGYGGFSLINPEKVDAEKFPDVGKIPSWQLARINAGDCLYLPSQMWHQVKSYGEVNRAVSFLFSQFEGRNEINTTNCPKDLKTVPLANVDVDLQYPGHGLMTMGNFELSSTHEILNNVISQKKHVITKRAVYKLVYHLHQNGAANEEKILKNAKAIYNYFLNLAEGNQKFMNKTLIENLKRDDIRELQKWMFPTEPSNSYDHEYSYLLPEDLADMVNMLMEENNGVLHKDIFIANYLKKSGSLKFGEELWKNLAGEEESISELNDEKLSVALEKYEYHRREKRDEEIDEDDVIVTPQGHKSQPKKFRGGYKDEQNNGDQVVKQHEEL